MPSRASRVIHLLVAALVHVSFLFCILFSTRPAQANRALGDRVRPLPTIFFDLGDVLIDTSDWNNLRYKAGAREYIETLRQRGYRLGLITNIPQDWGRTRDEKYRALQATIAKTWKESEPFPWTYFERVLLPPNDRLRKPHPYLFAEALSYGDICRPVYQGEDPAEIQTASRMRFVAWLSGAPNKPFFLPLRYLTCRTGR